jgi:hypothetical protein
MNNHTRRLIKGLAAYLMERGFYCVGTVKETELEPIRYQFVFVDVPDPKAIEDSWYRYRKESLSARSYFEKLRTVRQLLREGGTK